MSLLSQKSPAKAKVDEEQVKAERMKAMGIVPESSKLANASHAGGMIRKSQESSLSGINSA